MGHINVILPRLQVSLCLATILLLTCSHFHLQWPFLTSWMASLVEMRPGCNIINQVDFERLFLKFNLSIFHDLWLYSHVPLDALLPFAYPDNFQVTWLRLRRSLRWGTWGRQPFSGATKGGDYAKSKYIGGITDCRQ